MTRELKEKRDQRIERVAKLVDRSKYIIKASVIAKTEDYVFALPNGRLVEALKGEGVLVPREIVSIKEEENSTKKKKTKTCGSTAAKALKPALPRCSVESCEELVSNPAFSKCTQCHQGVPPHVRPNTKLQQQQHTRICILRKKQQLGAQKRPRE